MAIDPFAEPDDSERTIIRPRPAGVGRGAPPPQAAAPSASAEPAVLARTGTNQLVAAASPVLAAAIRIAAERGRMPDLERLRVAMVDAIHKFESDALALGLENR